MWYYLHIAYRVLHAQSEKSIADKHGQLAIITLGLHNLTRVTLADKHGLDCSNSNIYLLNSSGYTTG